MITAPLAAFNDASSRRCITCESQSCSKASRDAIAAGPNECVSCWCTVVSAVVATEGSHRRAPRGSGPHCTLNPLHLVSHGCSTRCLFSILCVGRGRVSGDNDLLARRLSYSVSRSYQQQQSGALPAGLLPSSRGWERARGSVHVGACTSPF